MEIVVHDTAYYDKLAAQNHRGLVPMILLENAMPYAVGDVAGFIPKDARAMHGAGQAVPYFPNGAEQPQPEIRTTIPDNATEIARLNAIQVDPSILTEPKPAQITLAKKIANTTENLSAEKAREIIQTELNRRVPGVNSASLRGTGS